MKQSLFESVNRSVLKTESVFSRSERSWLYVGGGTWAFRPLTGTFRMPVPFSTGYDARQPCGSTFFSELGV